MAKELIVDRNMLIHNPPLDVSIVIPARLGATRFPKKLLADLGGKPVIQHTWERAQAVSNARYVYVITDAKCIADLVQSWGGAVIMSDPECSSGTQRIVSVLDQTPGDYLVNIQADEPFISIDLIEGMIDSLKNRSVDVLTPIYPLLTQDALLSPHVVKVVKDQAQRALYFSRSPIPYIRGCPEADWLQAHTFYGHMGIYCYSRQMLINYKTFKSGTLEVAEQLEQLLFLEHGYTIYVWLAKEPTIAIDVPEDLERARHYLTLL